MFNVTQAATEDQELASRDESVQWFQRAAELGNRDAMDVLKQIYRDQRRAGLPNPQALLLSEQYWGLLFNISGSKEDREKFAGAYRGPFFNDQDRELMTRAIETHSLGCSQPTPSSGDLPGRSTLTCALVDTLLRRQLEFVWSSCWII